MGLDIVTKNILRSEGLPPFALHAGELIARSADPEGSSAGLTRVILKDLGLTSQILRTANSSIYNRSGKPILNVAHAIALLGWETIRNLVNALRFVEHFSSHSPGLRELMMSALMTATHGRQVAASIGYPRPEEAYICSLFRNLGEVLIARYYPREYSRIVVAMDQEKLAERTACLRVLEFTWDDVAFRLAGSWNLPQQVSMCLAPPGMALSNVLDRSLASIASYGLALTTALYRNSARLDAIHLKPVIDLKGNPHFISPRSLHRIVNDAVEDTKQTFAALRIPINTLKLERQVEAAQILLSAVPAGAEAVESAPAARDLKGDLAVDLTGDLTVDLTVDLTNKDPNLTAVIVECLELVVRCGFHRALFALLNENRELLQGRLGAGADIDAALERFKFPMGKPNPPVEAVLLRRQDLLVTRAIDGRYDRTALVAALNPAVFALYAVVVDNLVVGCIYADITQARATSPPDGRIHLGAARDRIAAALKKVRSVA